MFAEAVRLLLGHWEKLSADQFGKSAQTTQMPVW